MATKVHMHMTKANKKSQDKNIQRQMVMNWTIRFCPQSAEVKFSASHRSVFSDAILNC